MKNLLLVEDEAVVAMAEKNQLEGLGYSVSHVFNGEDAVSYVGAHSVAAEIDLILMDIDLGPGFDGPEAAQKILCDNDILIVFLSSHSEPEIVEKTEKITSYGYVLKNSAPSILDASIKMAFKLFDEKKKGQTKEVALKQQRDDYVRISNILESVLSALPGSLNVVDLEYNLLLSNKESFLVQPLQPGIHTGEKCYTVFQKRNSPCPWCNIGMVFETGKQYTEITAPDDPRTEITGRLWKVSAIPLKDEDGRLIGAIEYNQDITQMKRIEQELEGFCEN